MNVFARAAAALLVAIGTAGCMTADLTPSASVTTIMQGWERYFRIEWVPGTVPNFGRSYFLIPELPAADHYSVSVWSFDIIDTDGFFRRRF